MILKLTHLSCGLLLLAALTLGSACVSGPHFYLQYSDEYRELDLEKILAGEWKKGSIPEFWDGKTSERIVASLLSIYSKKLTPAK